MLVVISDIHFQDKDNHVIIEDENIKKPIDPNVSITAFSRIFGEIESRAADNKAQELVLILAGDIFEMNRSQKWLGNKYRPYGNFSVAEWGSAAEDILDGIVKHNEQTIAYIREVFRPSSKSPKKRKIVYIPGNHDRIINVHPPLRKKVRKVLGLQGANDAPFPHYYRSDEYGVLVFHGHEFHSANFSGKIPPGGIQKIECGDYDKATLGDYATIDIAMALGYEYKKLYGDKWEKNAVHRAIYRKLLEFDDVRPQSDLMNFLQSELPPGQDAWEYVEPVFKTIVKNAFKDDFLKSKLGVWGKLMDVIPRQLIPSQLFLSFIARAGSPRKLPCMCASNDQFLQEKTSRFIVSGHSHCPTVEFLRKRDDSQELFFFDSGTWRQQIRRCLDNRSFSRAKALTYILFYRPDEDPSLTNDKKGYSFDFWNGFTKKEFVGP
jgi:UDP-2,3-diacylglucosamine pyrophosphatase LpxH